MSYRSGFFLISDADNAVGEVQHAANQFETALSRAAFYARVVEQLKILQSEEEAAAEREEAALAEDP